MLIIEGDLLDTPFQIIAHQVNCLGVMGAGLAKNLRQKYPELYTVYNEYCKLNDYDSDLLGNSLLYDAPDGKIVVNLFGQYNYGKDRRYTDYDALEKAVKDAIRTIYCDAMKEDGIQFCIAIPYGLGCGLAGGDWEIVKKILEDIEKEENVLFIAYQR